MIYQLEGAYKDSEGIYHDTIKIGFSSDPFEATRKQSYDTHNSGYRFLGECAGTRDDEANLQRLFSEDNLHGEWFKDSPEIRFVFQKYDQDLWKEIKSFISLCRYSGITKLWAQLLQAGDDWLDFLWSLSVELGKDGVYGQQRLYDYPEWSGPKYSNHMPPRHNLRKALKKVGGNYGKKILGWIPDVPDLNVSVFDSQFLFNLKSEYALPCYPGLFRDYCEYLDRNKDRDNIRNMFYDPRPKLCYEGLGTSGCRELGFSLEKCYEKVCSEL